MRQLGWMIDPDKCTRCFACVNSCKFENNTLRDLTVNYRWVVTQESGVYPNPKQVFFPMSCLHCEEPACMKACPVGAITKRKKDGIVLIDQDKCNGCRYCVWACPYGAPQFNSVTRKVEKCTFCVQRIDEGLQPACVATCVGRALTFGVVGEDLRPGGDHPDGFADPGLTIPSVEFR